MCVCIYLRAVIASAVEWLLRSLSFHSFRHLLYNRLYNKLYSANQYIRLIMLKDMEAKHRWDGNDDN